MRSRRSVAALVLLAQSSVVVVLGPAAPVRAAGVSPSEWVIGAQRRVALITFEGKTKDRPLGRVMDVLATKRAKVSFFFPGSWIRAHPNQARRVRRAGHPLGNRGYGGTSFTRMSSDAVRSSIARAGRALRSVGASPRPFLRAPQGKRDLGVLKTAAGMGYRHVRWTNHPRGGRTRIVKRRAVRRAQAGSIIALDLWRSSNRKALPGIIKGLRRRGFDLRTVDALKNVQPVRWDVTLRPGSRGSYVKFLDRRLRAISYPSGRPDTRFDYPTLQAVYAYEKSHNMARNGVVNPRQMKKLVLDGRPRAPKRGRRNFVDIDISRQVLFEVRKGKVRHTLPISSGNEEYYWADGRRYKAHTPRGNFSIVRKIAGWRTSFLGRLYYPSYFVGGFAVHGSTSVPTYPASHGCVRIPMYVTKGFFRRSPIGRAVFVHN